MHPERRPANDREPIRGRMRSAGPGRRPLAIGLYALMVACGTVGCGTALETFFFQQASGSAQTLADLLLTGAVNGFANVANPPDTGASTGGGNGGSPFDGLTGVAATGQTFFSTNTCPTCHCPDASGGCNALNAPSLVGVSALTLDGKLRGGISHTGGTFNIDDQGIVDLEAHLANP